MKKILCFFYKVLFGSNKEKYVFYYYFYFRNRNNKLGDFFHYLIESKYNLVISKKAILGNNVQLVHPIGVVIGAHVIIGDNVKIFQNVTIGGGRLGDADSKRMPRIGEGSTIFAGAVIVGDISIGSNCIIGANSVVNSDIPDNCVAVGVPAKVINKIK